MKQHGVHHQPPDIADSDIVLNRKMKRFLKKAKRHKPTRSEGDPGALINRLNHNQALSELEITVLDGNVTLAIQAFSTGNGTPHHWNNLVDANNLCQQFDAMGIESGHAQELAATDDALRAALNRHNSGKNLAFDGPGLQAVKAMADVHLAMLQQCTRGGWCKALDNLAADVAKAPPGGTVSITDHNPTGAKPA